MHLSNIIRRTRLLHSALFINAEVSCNQLLLFANSHRGLEVSSYSRSRSPWPCILPRSRSAAWPCACCNLKHHLALDPVNSCHPHGLCHPVSHGPDQAGTVIACSTGYHQTSLIDTFRQVVTCIHHNELNLASASMRPFLKLCTFSENCSPAFNSAISLPQ